MTASPLTARFRDVARTAILTHEKARTTAFANSSRSFHAWASRVACRAINGAINIDDTEQCAWLDTDQNSTFMWDVCNEAYSELRRGEPPPTQWVRPVVLFALAHGRTPEEQLAADDVRWPGGVMCGYLLWISQAQQRWNAEKKRDASVPNFAVWLEANYATVGAIS